jgi:hypothetical protein
MRDFIKSHCVCGITKRKIPNLAHHETLEREKQTANISLDKNLLIHNAKKPK